MVRTMNKLDVDFIVYHPAEGAGFVQADTFGWAVNGMPIDDETSALNLLHRQFPLKHLRPVGNIQRIEVGTRKNARR